MELYDETMRVFYSKKVRLCLNQVTNQGLKLTLDRRPEASDFSIRPVNLQPYKSGGLVFFNIYTSVHFKIKTDNLYKYLSILLSIEALPIRKT